MMAANWTAVRRRLAIRRTAHRPPRGGRQAGHSSIVAPLAATLAASVAVGIGVALAQAERTRRSAKRLRKRERRFTKLPNEPLSQALQRMALGQLDLAIELLADGAPDERAIHETRKALKRLRALMRLLRHELGESRFRREHGILRDAARRLAGARDAEVMVDTLDALLTRHPRKLGQRRPLTQMRKRLVAERSAAARRTLGDEATRAEVLSELRGLRTRAQWWNLSEQPDLAIVERDLRRIYGQGRRRYRHVARGKRRGKNHDTRALHEWRKAVKDLRYAAEMLGLRPLAHRADTLGEILGEDHDLALLAALLPPSGRAPFKGKRGKRARKALLEQIARRRRRLRKRALGEGAHLYRRKPKRFIRRARRAHARA
jgi:CHAD domain-containing protein